MSLYIRLQTVWSLPGHSRQANKDHSPRCHRRRNGPGRLADTVVQPTTQSAEGRVYIKNINFGYIFDDFGGLPWPVASHIFFRN